MKKHAWNQIVLAALIAALGAMSSLSLAQEKGASPPRSQPTSHTAQQEETSRGGPQEGIKVHGHWTIVIKNPDGSVASLDDFENSLAAGTGDLLLATIISRNASVSTWAVSIDGPTGAQPCINQSGAQASCFLSEPNGFGDALKQNFSGALTMKQVGATVVLSGSAKSANGGQITGVGTVLGTCSATVAPSACDINHTNNGGQFTVQNRSSLTVQAGQTIDVTVVLSFS